MNVEIYPLKANEKFAFALSATLAEDGTPDDGTFDQARRPAQLACPPCACVTLRRPNAVGAGAQQKVAARQVRVRHVR